MSLKLATIWYTDLGHANNFLRAVKIPKTLVYQGLNNVTYFPEMYHSILLKRIIFLLLLTNILTHLSYADDIFLTLSNYIRTDMDKVCHYSWVIAILAQLSIFDTLIDRQTDRQMATQT